MNIPVTLTVTASVPATASNTPLVTDVGFWQEIINWVMNLI
jgi:hypothetical protein